MELSDEARARIRAEEAYRHEVFSELNKPTKHSAWDRLNSPIMIWFLGSVVLGLISYLYAEHSETLKAARDARALSYGVQVRLAPVERLVTEVLRAGGMTDDQRYRISNSFTGKMEQAPDTFGRAGVPDLLFKFAAVSGDSEAARIARDYSELMVPLEKEGLYARGAGQQEVDLTEDGRELLQRLSVLAAEAKRIVLRSTNEITP